MFLRNILLVFNLITISCSKRIHSIGGPYKVEFKKMMDCPPELRGLGLLGATLKEKRLSAKSSEHHFDINMTFLTDLSDDLGAAVHLASWSNIAGWQSNAYVVKFPSICFNVEKIYIGAWTALMQGVFGEYCACPLLAGVYRMENVTLSGHVQMLKYFVYGRWRADGQAIRKNGQVVGCSRSVIDTVPIL